MKYSLSGSIHIFLTAKSSMVTKTCTQLSTLEKNIVLLIRPYDKTAFHPEWLVHFVFS